MKWRRLSREELLTFRPEGPNWFWPAEAAWVSRCGWFYIVRHEVRPLIDSGRLVDSGSNRAFVYSVETPTQGGRTSWGPIISNCRTWDIARSAAASERQRLIDYPGVA